MKIQLNLYPKGSIIINMNKIGEFIKQQRKDESLKNVMSFSG
jgi:hypothetical protein